MILGGLMDIPTRKSRSRNLKAPFSMMMTPEMKDQLSQLSTFEDVDVPEWIRQLIQDALNKRSSTYRQAK